MLVSTNNAITFGYVNYALGVRREFQLNSRLVASLGANANVLAPITNGDLYQQTTNTISKEGVTHFLVMTDNQFGFTNPPRFIPSFFCELGFKARTERQSTTFFRVELHVTRAPLLRGEYFITGNNNNLSAGTWEYVGTYPTLTFGWRGITKMFRPEYELDSTLEFSIGK